MRRVPKKEGRGRKLQNLIEVNVKFTTGGGSRNRSSSRDGNPPVRRRNLGRGETAAKLQKR